MKSRKGLSSVVGTVFSIIALITVITYVTYSMNTLQQFNQEVMTKNTELIDQGKEEISIVKADSANSKFNITVQNSGSLPVNITRLYIQNKTDPTWGTYKYDINVPVSPGEVATNIGQSINLYALSTQGYEIKLTTERGNAEEFSINSPSQKPLFLELHALPEAIPTEFTTTVMFQVTNNMSNNNILTNLTPNSLQIASVCKTTCSATYVSGPIPTSYPSLKNGDTATFKWIYEIQGSAEDTATFTATLQNGLNNASSTVTVKDIISSLEAGSAIESLGLKTPTGTSDILYLHNETYFTPSSSYQLSTATPDMPGGWTDVDDYDPSWFTNNGTSTIIMPAGVWNASLRYVNEYLPDRLVAAGSNQVDMLFYLNSNVDKEPDSTLNTSNLDRCNNAPTFVSSGGPHNSAYYDFDGVNDCIDSNFNVESHSDIQQAPDTTSLWFRAPQVETNNRGIMFRADANATSGTTYSVDLYQISLGDGTVGNKRKVVFEYDTSDGTARTKCVSSSRADNSTWHHVVAVRQSDDKCKLFLDGLLQMNDSTSSFGSNSVDTVDKFHIGYNGFGEWFDGDIDNIFHWNDKALIDDEVTALYNADFGNASSKITFTIDKTDENGNILQNIVTNASYPMPFKDSFDAFSTSYSSFADSVWGQANYTISLPQVTVSPGERLNFTMEWKSGLDMILWQDDQSMTTPKSSFIQMPLPNGTFPSYFTFSKANQLSVYVYNVGPYGSWFVYQGTRAVFENSTSTRSWAGLICAVNSTDLSPPTDACSTSNNAAWTLTEDRDSVFIPVNSTAITYFWDIQDRPDQQSNAPSSEEIPDGDYNVYVFIDGYDERGQKFLRNLSLGLVKVTP